MLWTFTTVNHYTILKYWTAESVSIKSVNYTVKMGNFYGLDVYLGQKQGHIQKSGKHCKVTTQDRGAQIPGARSQRRLAFHGEAWYLCALNILALYHLSGA